MATRLQDGAELRDQKDVTFFTG